MNELRTEYMERGWCRVQALVPGDAIDLLVASYLSSVRPHVDALYMRQTGAKACHVLSDGGHVINGLLNPHAEVAGEFGEACGAFMRQAALLDTADALLDTPTRAAQMMFFDGAPSTLSHQDRYYLDGEPSGNLVGAWVALEDISPQAGRFYLYDLNALSDVVFPDFTEDDVYRNGTYMPRMAAILRPHVVRRAYPQMKKGDVIFWSPWVVHGTNEARDNRLSRRSTAIHYVAKSSRLVNAFGTVYTEARDE